MKDERLDALKARRDRLNALIQQRNAHSRVQAQKESTRRKLVAGAILLEGLLTHEPLRRWFEAQLKSQEERRLFGLDESPATAESGQNECSSPRAQGGPEQAAGS